VAGASVLPFRLGELSLCRATSTCHSQDVFSSAAAYTSVRAHKLGLGLAALGRPGYMTLGHADDLEDTSKEAMRLRCFEVLDAAWAAGVRTFDVARSYGHAELFLKQWIEHRAVSGFSVNSKWGYRYTANWQRRTVQHEVKDLSLSHFQKQSVETVRLLGTFLTRYYIHSATIESGVLDDGALLDALAAFKERGVAIGLTTTGATQRETIERASELRVDGVALFSAVESTWNVFEPSVEPALAAAHAQGWHVTVKEALANGRLSSRSDDPRWLAYCAEREVSPDCLALAAAVQKPWADCVLSGAVTVAQLTSNLQGVDIVTPVEFDPPTSAAEYWRRRAQLPWQ
jgi:aryl-alcohol dehydrogenase-like predicted oxidoreductase